MILRTFAAACLAAAVASGLTGCQEQTASERAQEAIDDAAEEAADAAEDAADAVKKAFE